MALYLPVAPLGVHGGSYGRDVFLQPVGEPDHLAEFGPLGVFDPLAQLSGVLLRECVAEIEGELSQRYDLGTRMEASALALYCLDALHAGVPFSSACRASVGVPGNLFIVLLVTCGNLYFLNSSLPLMSFTRIIMSIRIV